MNFRIKDYFTFTKSERNGVLVLLGIIALLIVGIHATQYIQQQTDVDFSEFEKEIIAFEQQLTSEKQDESSEPIVSLAKFNPNHLTIDQWERMGLKPYLAKRIKKYESKGGSFKKKEDVKKIYGFTDSLYRKLEKFMVIPKIDDVAETINSLDQPNLVQVEVNTAKEIQFELIKGIGPVFAKRIVKYRKLLGGFYSKEQLRDVYGLNDSIYQKIQNQLVLNNISLTKINVNKANAKVFVRHPYITNWNLANAIVNYREQHGPYKSIEDLKKIQILEDSIYAKIAPYISIQ